MYRISGWASVFNEMDAIGDVILPGAFGAVDTKSVPMYRQHSFAYASPGRWETIRETPYGLYVDGICAERPSVSGLSIGFRPILWIKDRDGNRILEKVSLVEISLVRDPMQRKAVITRKECLT